MPLPMTTVADVVTIDFVGGTTENADAKGATENAVDEARYDKVEGRVTAVVVEVVDFTVVGGDEVLNGVEFVEYWIWNGIKKNDVFLKCFLGDLLH